MVDYSISTKKSRKGYAVIVRVKDGHLLKPLVRSINEFFEVWRLLRENIESKEVDYTKEVQKDVRRLKKAKTIKPDKGVE